ncbi:MAG: ABC transporter ATP-binding protein, partial [Pseudomonadota bacterium]|nr:ABC transporter ATP-binding protein [Pseudomonadota bacterium]
APTKPAQSRPASPAAHPGRGRSGAPARELAQLLARIEALEARLGVLAEAMNDPAFYQRDKAGLAAHHAEMAAAQAELEAEFGRWEAIEGQAG